MRKLFLLPFVLLAGCGGGGGGSTADGKSRLSIDWPARVRGFAGSPLAESALVRFGSAVDSTVLYQFPLQRPEGTGAVTKRYTLPDEIAPGTYVLSVLFCAGTDSNPANAVGFGSASATVRANGDLRGGDGKSLGDVAFTSSLASLAVNANQTVVVGERKSLFVSATTQGSGIVAIPYSEVSLTVTDGGSSLRANSDGTVTGLAPGTAMVVARAYGVTSPAGAVTIVAGR